MNQQVQWVGVADRIVDYATRLNSWYLRFQKGLESGYLIPLLEREPARHLEIRDLNRRADGNWQALWSVCTLPDFRFQAEGGQSGNVSVFNLVIEGNGPFKFFRITRSHESKTCWIQAPECGPERCSPEALQLKEVLIYLPTYECYQTQTALR